MTDFPLPTLAVAPMEGLTGRVFRRVHAWMFGGADCYYIPFVSPTAEPALTARQLRELDPAVNAGLPVVPQLLTNRPADFIWAARTLAAMGYPEVNLNLGCPSGTVVAKSKGAGLLRDTARLEAFLTAIFEACPDVRVTFKTRIGFSSETEWEALSALLSRYPARLAIVHPRLRTDFYKGSVRETALQAGLKHLTLPWGYNGDMVTAADLRSAARRHPEARMLMVGRGLMADPALLRKARGGAAATAEEIRAFSGELFAGYAELFESRNNAVARLKEYWFYQVNLFEGGERFSRRLVHARTPEAFFAEVDALIGACPIRQDATADWARPL